MVPMNEWKGEGIRRRIQRHVIHPVPSHHLPQHDMVTRTDFTNEHHNSDDDDDIARNNGNTSDIKASVTMHRNTANIFDPTTTASTPTVIGNYNSTSKNLYINVNANSTTGSDTSSWSPLRISGLVTLVLTLFTYIGLHVLASKHRKRQRRQRPRQQQQQQQQQSLETTQFKPDMKNSSSSSNNKMICTGEDCSQRSSKKTPLDHSPSTKSPPQRYTTTTSTSMDVPLDDVSIPNHVHSIQACCSTSADYSHISVTPVYTTTTTKSTSIMVRSDDSTTDSNSIPNTIVAKHKKKGKKHSKVQLTTFPNDVVTSDLLLGPHDELEVDHGHFGLTQSSNTALTPTTKIITNTTTTTATTNTTTSTVDDDELLFYEQTLQFSHHGQRENIPFPIPHTDGVINLHHQYDEHGIIQSGNDQNNVIPILSSSSSLWVSNEDSFLFPPTNTDL
jgi:hemin uptake protein HemP